MFNSIQNYALCSHPCIDLYYETYRKILAKEPKFHLLISQKQWDLPFSELGSMSYCLIEAAFKTIENFLPYLYYDMLSGIYQLPDQYTAFEENGVLWNDSSYVIS